MSLDNNFFVTFPVSDTQTVSAGTLRIDFINGKATLPNETVIPLVNRSLQIKSLQSIFFNIDNDINVEMSLNNETVYNGLIPAGHFTLKNIKYDLLLITTTTNTEIFVAGSFKTDCIVTEISSSHLLPNAATTPALYRIVMLAPDTEYSQLLPASTKQIEFRCRTPDDIRYAFETGIVAGPVDPYKSLLSGEIKSQSDLNLSSTTLYCACSAVGKIVELEVWT